MIEDIFVIKTRNHFEYRDAKGMFISTPHILINFTNMLEYNSCPICADVLMPASLEGKPDDIAPRYCQNCDWIFDGSASDAIESYVYNASRNHHENAPEVNND